MIVTILYGQSGARYLVITPDVFSTTLQPLIEWKYKKGMVPVVYTLSQIGSDSLSLKNFIANAYNTWEIKPEYVILVGHPGYIPMHYYQYGGYHYYTDNYYTNVTGGIYNEMIPGRLSVNSTSELETVINKIIQYERYPLTSDTSWFMQGTAIANCDGSDDSIYLHCMRYAESLATSNGFAHVDTFANIYGNSASQVIGAINQGRIFVLYRGNANNHWYNPFDVNPYSTSNGAKLPIILSITCRTVSANSSPILGENFLRVGTPSSPRGAVGFIGGTRNTGNAAHLRNAVAMGCLDVLYIDGRWRLGEIAEGGRKRVYQQYGELREYNNFTCLGDPELNVWTDTPCSLCVSHPEFVPYAGGSVLVSVHDSEDSLPVSDAYVCISGKSDSSVYVVDTTSANGQVQATLSPAVLGDTLYVTVTGRNLQPYEGGMEVRLLSYAYIMYQKSSVSDSIGNDDGKINPTEEIELPLWVENIGESTAVQTIGTINTNDSYIVLLDSVKDFGDIPGRDSMFTGPDGYTFSVPYGCPDNHAISFSLVCTDINDSVWVSGFSRYVFSPRLYRDMVIVEGGNNNGIVDPGETLSVIVTIGNQGSASADDTDGVLYTEQGDISIIDSTGWFGHIGIDSTTDNADDPFIIYVDSTIAIGTTIEFVMPVQSNYCADTFIVSLIVGSKHYYIWNPDPSPSSGQEIHNQLTALGYSGDYGATLPATLDHYRAVFVCLGVYSNRYLITQGSAEAVQLIEYMNNGGRVYMEGSSVWHVDPEYFNGHDFGPDFGLQGFDWSYGDLGPVAGQNATFTVGMSFNYSGENAYMDHLSSTGGGYTVFRDVDNYYNCGIAYDAGDYRTVGLSFELIGLEDGSPPSTRSVLLDSIMKFFGVNDPGIAEEGQFAVQPTGFGIQSISPNPFSTQCVLKVQLTLSSKHYAEGGKEHFDKTTNTSCGTGSAKGIELRIFDVAGRMVRDLSDALPHTPCAMQVTWSGRDDQNKPLPAGIYFVHLTCNGMIDVKKTVLLK